MGKKKIQTIGETIEETKKPQTFNKQNKEIKQKKTDPENSIEEILDKVKDSQKPTIEQKKINSEDTKTKKEKSEPKRGKNKIRSKKYQTAKELVDPEKSYNLEEAIELVKKIAYSKFKSNIETHIRLNINLSKSEEQVRTIIKFPKYLGKKPKILALTSQKDTCIKAGATHAGGKEMVDEISKGWFDFNLIVAEPKFMPSLGKIAKLLGRKGLMPNPKTGTISDNVETKISEILAGSIEVKNDTSGIIHQVIGRVDESNSDLIKNFQILFTNISKNKSNNKDFIKSIHLSPSMGPSVKIDMPSINTKSIQK